MRLLIVGSLQGQIGLATKIAMDKGAKVSHAGDIEQAMATLRSGMGADLVFCDVSLDIAALVRGLSAEVSAKLVAVQPGTIGQASRISGVTPAAISLLLVHLKRGGRRVA